MQKASLTAGFLHDCHRDRQLATETATKATPA
jgi:hypothetical protein